MHSIRNASHLKPYVTREQPIEQEPETEHEETENQDYPEHPEQHFAFFVPVPQSESRNLINEETSSLISPESETITSPAPSASSSSELPESTSDSNSDIQIAESTEDDQTIPKTPPAPLQPESSSSDELTAMEFLQELDEVSNLPGTSDPETTSLTSSNNSQLFTMKFSDLNKPELQDLLDHYNLDTSGLMSDLKIRLSHHIADNIPTHPKDSKGNLIFHCDFKPTKDRKLSDLSKNELWMVVKLYKIKTTGSNGPSRIFTTKPQLAKFIDAEIRKLQPNHPVTAQNELLFKASSSTQNQ